MFHSGGVQETFTGPGSVDKFLKRVKKVAVNIQTQEAINKVMTHADMDKGLKKLKASLKPFKKAKK